MKIAKDKVAGSQSTDFQVHFAVAAATIGVGAYSATPVPRARPAPLATALFCDSSIGWTKILTSSRKPPVNRTTELSSWLPQKLLLTAVFAGVLALPGIPEARASTVTFDYDTMISGATPPGSGPWVTATFDDGGGSGTVTLTMMSSGLSGAENISGMYFNLDPALNPASLSFSYLGTTGPAATSVQAGVNSFKADGDGKYDILFSFPTSNGFNANETVQYQITGIPSLTAQSFNFLSACGSPSCTGPGNFYAAAHVQNINGSSGWIASNVGVVPLPSAMWLLGSGLVGLIGIARRPAT